VEYLTITEIARMYKVSRQSVHKWIREKGLPADRVGNLWRIRKDNLALWVTGRGAYGSNSKWLFRYTRHKRQAYHEQDHERYLFGDSTAGTRDINTKGLP